MIALTVDRYGYAYCQTDEWLDDISEVDAILTDSLNTFAQDEQYVTDDVVRNWLATFGEVSGIYGEDGPITVSTCNHDSFLYDDVTYTFAHAGDETLIVVHGFGYFLSSPGSAIIEVRRFIGDDDSDVLDFAHAYASHTSNRECGADWIVEDAVTLWPNGGGQTYRLAEQVKTFDDDDPYVACPLCGDRLVLWMA